MVLRLRVGKINVYIYTCRAEVKEYLYDVYVNILLTVVKPMHGRNLVF